MLGLHKIKSLFKASPKIEEKRITNFESLYRNSIARDPKDHSINGIVFSMDRAIQLYGLLESYFDHVVDPAPLHVIYRATTPEHLKAYEEVFQLTKHLPIIPVLQIERNKFRPLVLDLLNQIRTSRIFFLVDDILFIEPVELQCLAQLDTRDYVPSLRLGEHLTRCYTMNLPQELPRFETNLISNKEMLIWSWKQGQLDWGYPLSVDGHIFDRQEILYFIQNTDFSAPNTLEGHLQRYQEYFSNRRGVCFRKGRIVNIPWNKVQNENNNLHGNLHQNELLEHWNKGSAIDVQSYYGSVNLSCHQEYDLKVKTRVALKAPKFG